MAKKGGRIQVGARLPPELWERLRVYAERNGQPMSVALEKAVSEFLDDVESVQLPAELLEVVESWYRENVSSGK